MNDPVTTDPDLYRVVFENDRVRVLEYRDKPGDKTHLHRHPDSVMVPLSSFSRIIEAGGVERAVELHAGQARWLNAQQHQGSNVGETNSHALFIELKDPRTDQGAVALGQGHGQAQGTTAIGPSLEGFGDRGP
jgi:beta-alanine degradation protein BauB